MKPKKMQVIWTPRAAQSLTEIIRYIAQDNPSAARKMRDKIVQKANLLQEMPLLGVQWEGNLRKLSLGDYPYALYYRVTADAIQILRVRHEKRLPPQEIH
jgi:toxin ParE1/3/4